MLLAELEVWHSRPFTPTRRVALGHLVLPVDPAPGFGGLLLGAVVAAHVRGVDDELVPDVHRLINQVEYGQRIVQPRLRHRFQVDRHGLTSSVHRLVGDETADHHGELSFEFGAAGKPLQQVLGAIYAVERLAPDARHALVPLLHKAMRWRGPIGPALIAHLAGSTTTRLAAFADPRAWAMEVLGFPVGSPRPGRREVKARFRARLHDVHPDHGASGTDAAVAIDDLAEARRILLT